MGIFHVFSIRKAGVVQLYFHSTHNARAFNAVYNFSGAAGLKVKPDPGHSEIIRGAVIMTIISLVKNLKTFVMISWRNMLRQKRRSLVVIASMAIGIFAMIISVGFLNGMTIQMVENTISTSLGHIAIHKKGYQDNMKLEYNFYPEQTYYEILKKNKAIKSFARRVKIQGMIRSSEASRGVMVVGVDPDQEKTVSKLYDYTSKKEGSRFLSDPSADEVLIARSLADKLDLYMGDKLVLMIQDENNQIVGVGLQIVGFFETPVDAFDKFVVFTGIKKLQEITGLGDNISEITVLTDNKDSVDPVKKYLVDSIDNKGLEILSWKDMAPNLISAIKLMDTMMYIFFMIIFVTVIFSVANTLIMSIMERYHELGVMKCIGTRPSQIFFMVLFEAVNLGLVGLAAGIIVGVSLVIFFGQTGIDLSFAMDALRKWKIGSVIYPLILMKDILAATSVVLTTTIVAAIYPALKAARIKPLDALHYI
jgi:putative ABC transport system permease protein